MTGSVTWEQIVSLIIIATAVAGAWWFLFAQILQTRRELNDFKLEVSRQYASHDHLREVEERLTKVIEKLDRRIEDMPRQLAAAVQAALKN